MLLFIVSFLSGALALGIVQLLLLLYFIQRLSRNKKHATSEGADVPVEAQAYPLSTQGIVWVAAVSPQILEKAVLKVGQRQKQENGSKVKKDEIRKGLITPSPTYAKLANSNLILTSDGSNCCILMEGCDVKAVSGSSTASKKWSKKYPIMLQHDTRPLFGGSTICLLYFETSWEKETWCEVLREAARRQHSDKSWYSELKNDFKDYMKLIKERYPSSIIADSLVLDGKYGAQTTEAVPAKKLWKKLLKRASKGMSRETKSNEQSKDDLQSKLLVGPPSDLKVHEEAAPNTSLQRSSSWHTDDFHKSNVSSDEESRHAGTDRFLAGISSAKNFVAADLAINKDAPLMFNVSGDGDQPEKHGTDGVLCWNILFSRIFFDLYRSSVMVGTLQTRIQMLLSKVETPSYISKLSCTHLDLGKAPPIVQGMRALPFDLSGVSGVEADIDYSGGAILTIETRLNLQDTNLQEKAVDQPLESSLVDAATSGLLKESPDSVDYGLEIVRQPDFDQACQSEEGNRTAEVRNKSDNTKVPKVSNQKQWVKSMVGWKSMISHVVEQVSQVPIVLSVRVLSLKGTLQVRIKEPPSDRIWVGFASMPTIEFAPEPSIGDHKFSTGPLIAFIVERIKILLRETMVLPHLEQLSIPWMISDKDDWLAESLVPIPWSLPRSNDSAHSEDSHRGGQSKAETKKEKLNCTSDGYVPPKPPTNPSTANLSLSAMTSVASGGQRATQKKGGSSSDLEKLLLDGVKHAETTSEQDSPTVQDTEKDDCLVSLGSPQTMSSHGETRGMPSDVNGADKQKGRTESRRTKMMTLGKRMGEKFEEKKRHFAEKMREKRDS